MIRKNYFREISPIASQRIKNYQCPSCGKDKREWIRRTDWLCCSKECTEVYHREHEKAYSWQEFRYMILKRDDSTCRLCGKRFVKKGLALPEVPDESQLIADHIIPIELGGHMWEKGNIQTLCVPCNKIKTKEDMGHIAVHRQRTKKKMEAFHKSVFNKPSLVNITILEKWF